MNYQQFALKFIKNDLFAVSNEAVYWVDSDYGHNLWLEIKYEKLLALINR